MTECSTEWTLYKSFCYKNFQGPIPWEDARKACLDIHSDLVSIHSIAENSFINTTYLAGNYWIGLNDKEQEGVFQWSDGTPYKFSIFSPNDVSKGDLSNCVAIRNGEWFDRSCAGTSSRICKKRGKINLILLCNNLGHN